MAGSVFGVFTMGMFVPQANSIVSLLKERKWNVEVNRAVKRGRQLVYSYPSRAWCCSAPELKWRRLAVICRLCSNPWPQKAATWCSTMSRYLLPSHRMIVRQTSGRHKVRHGTEGFLGLSGPIRQGFVFRTVLPFWLAFIDRKSDGHRKAP